MNSKTMTPPSSAVEVHAHNAVPAHHICYLSGDEAEPNPLDMLLHNQIAKFTAGVSPTSVTLAFVDWVMHLAASPGKQMELLALLQKPSTLSLPATPPASSESGADADTRFAHTSWNNWPYNLISGSFLKNQQFWQTATTGVRGMSAHHEYVVNFISRQMLDMFSPSNLPWLNPEVLQTTVETGGKNLLSGASHWLQDQGLELNATTDASGHAGTKKLAYQVGRDVAITPGKVVFRNHLIELIQYSPQTNKVYAEPILIVPSWIMKYYILDLSPHNSMVRFLVAQGHTVFMISWKNPGKEARDLGMQDYLSSGLFAALAEVAELTHKEIHTVGYCLGGTLLAMGAAALAKEASPAQKPSRASIKSVSLLAAQTDFSEPGELGLFIDESQLAMLDAQMWEKGYLDGDQMTGSFQILNSRDLVWSKIMREYQLGSRTAANDLMSWNADTTRMPYRMHSEYLKHLFLHNDLAEGRYEVNGAAIALNDLRVPMFVVGTARDHVSPWRSVYKINLLSDAPIEFVLASGGHNAGIVSEPGHARRSYQYLPAEARSKNYSAPEAWLRAATTEPGSWWIHWQQWLAQHSSTKQIKARYPQEHTELGIAPGSYVLEP
ncbi:PHA/PHB synthase family protein [Undibacterium sp. Ren11W]|uniref:PHA/PHB synthase family protein n=1 Tax=Undibacterium sp. Ren11W TaxID=3413045 RepID=UPI003BF3DBAB